MKSVRSPAWHWRSIAHMLPALHQSNMYRAWRTASSVLSSLSISTGSYGSILSGRQHPWLAWPRLERQSIRCGAHRRSTRKSSFRVEEPTDSPGPRDVNDRKSQSALVISVSRYYLFPAPPFPDIWRRREPKWRTSSSTPMTVTNGK